MVFQRWRTGCRARLPGSRHHFRLAGDGVGKACKASERRAERRGEGGRERRARRPIPSTGCVLAFGSQPASAWAVRARDGSLLLVAELSNHRVSVFGLDGTLECTFGDVAILDIDGNGFPCESLMTEAERAFAISKRPPVAL